MTHVEQQDNIDRMRGAKKATGGHTLNGAAIKLVKINGQGFVGLSIHGAVQGGQEELDGDVEKLIGNGQGSRTAREIQGESDWRVIDLGLMGKVVQRAESFVGDPGQELLLKILVSGRRMALGPIG